MAGIRRWRVAFDRDYAAFLLTALVIYILIFVGLYPVFQSRVWTVSLLPVTFIAWRYGRRSGVLSGFMVFALSLYLLYGFDRTGFMPLVSRSGVGGLALLELLALLVGSLRDVATQAKLEVAQRSQAEERFRVLSESSLVGIYLIQNNVLIYVNPALAAMFGYHPDEVNGKLDPADLFAPAYRLIIAENLRRRLTGVIDKHPYRLTGLRKDGTTFECEVLGRRVDYQGAPAIMGTLLDVTERQQVEQQTIALAVEHEKAALLRNFVTAISHEFRNPLAIINT
ncbi:MAG: PAS domain S-box protein, partial [Anaerolineae bacterium]|nr:PAS domain S-box protein [Anaerolineae bacterium]